MKKGLLLLALLLVVVGCKENENDVVSTKDLASAKDSLSYIIGTDIGRSLADLDGEVDLNILAQGMFDMFTGKELAISAEAAAPMMEKEMTRIAEKKAEERAATDPEFAKQYEAHKLAQAEQKAKTAEVEKAGLAYLASNKTKKGVITTASGLQYEIVKKGEGELPTPASTVEVHYTGTLIDGTVFDSSVKRGKTVSFPVTGVIPGWTEVLQLMPVGSQFKVTVPSNLAYGATPDPRTGIAPNSVLLFDIELVSIVK